MKRSTLLERFGDAVLEKVVVNLGVAGEIELTEDDPTLPEAYLVAFHAEATASALKFLRDGKAQVILTVDPGSFVIDSVEAPPEPPATAPMIGEDGEVLVGDGSGHALPEGVGEGFDKLEEAHVEDRLESCPFPGCTLAAEHEGDHLTEAQAKRAARKLKAAELPTEDVQE